jgi:uncharacterized protein YacL
MKLIGASLGLVIAWALHRFAQADFTQFLSTPSLATPIGAIAALLTAPWAVALGRLSVFEKLDDLPQHQVDAVVSRAGSVRRFIVRSTIVNTILIATAIGLLAFAPTSVVTQWLLPPFACVWIVGLWQAWRCWNALEASRLAIVEAQAREKKRRKYLDTLRSDDRKTPIDRNDPHLNRYSQSLGN